MSDSPVSIGLDVGTTNTKALAVETATGAVLHTVSHPTPVQSTQDGDFRDAEQTFAVVTSVLTDLIGCLGPSVVSRVICIGVASLGEELFMVDDRGRALELSPAWYNTTLATGVEHIDRTFGWHKLAWNHERMQANGTDTGRARGFTSLGGYIAARLAAHTAHDPILIDHTHASRTGFLHAEDASWDTAVFESTGWEAEMLPQITAPLHDARSIDPDFAEQLGLSMDVSVCSAGHDHLCAGYAVGARLPGTLFLSAGTAEAHLLIVDPDAVAEGIPEGVSVGRYVTDDGVYLHSQIAAGRIYQSWRRKLGVDAVSADLTTPEMLALIGNGTSAHVELQDAAGEATSEELLDAVSAGIAFAGVSADRELADFTGVEVERVVAVGPPTNDPRWRRHRAQLSDAPIFIAQVGEATGVGAAMIAAAARDVFVPTPLLTQLPVEDHLRPSYELLASQLTAAHHLATARHTTNLSGADEQGDHAS